MYNFISWNRNDFSPRSVLLLNLTQRAHVTAWAFQPKQQKRIGPNIKHVKEISKKTMIPLHNKTENVLRSQF